MPGNVQGYQELCEGKCAMCCGAELMIVLGRKRLHSNKSVCLYLQDKPMCVFDIVLWKIIGIAL